MSEWYNEQLSTMSNEDILRLLREESTNYTDDFIEAAMQELENRDNASAIENNSSREKFGEAYEEIKQNYCNRKKNKFSASLSNNETIVKTYHCTSLRRPSGEGYLTITNKRVVFQGQGSSGGGKSKLMSEVPIEHVSGVSSYYGYGLKVKFIIVGILLSILTILCAIKAFSSDSYDSSKNVYGTFAFLLAIIAIIFFAFSKKANFNLSVYSTGATGSPINIGNAGFGSKLTGQGAVFAIVAEPTDETEKMMDEVGAVVLDLKDMGDHAIDKWCDKDNNNDQKNKHNSNKEVVDEVFFK